ncbi:MAG: hypothetical protein HY821_00045 [Acidobacteria bacterium]|nr:hypothetical protein [Acidobacteriota bacterium]
MARYRVTITAGRKLMLELPVEEDVTVLDHGVRRLKEDRYSADVIVDEKRLGALAERGYQVERHEDVDQAGRERQLEVGRGNRFLKPR